VGEKKPFLIKGGVKSQAGEELKERAECRAKPAAQPSWIAFDQVARQGGWGRYWRESRGPKRGGIGGTLKRSVVTLRISNLSGPFKVI